MLKVEFLTRALKKVRGGTREALAIPRTPSGAAGHVRQRISLEPVTPPNPQTSAYTADPPLHTLPGIVPFQCGCRG